MLKAEPMKIIALGYKLGSDISTNESLEKKFNLQNNFIMQKTGISERRYFSKDEDPRDLAVSVAKELLKKMGILIPIPVFGSSNPYGKYQIPAPTMEIAHRLGFHNIPVFHINYGCGGYLGAIQSIYNYLQLHLDSTVLLILTDWPSSMVNKYETAVLFSDAIHVSIWSNSSKFKGLEVERVFYENALENPYALNVMEKMWNMDGSIVSKFVRTVPKLISKNMNIKLSDFEIVPHQPNARLLEMLEKDYRVPFFNKDVRKFGNTTCSAMMIALQNYLLNKIPHKKVLLMGFGDTESYGAVILKKTSELPLMI